MGIPNSVARMSSGLSFLACIPRITASKSVVIRFAFHPISAGKIPSRFKRDFDGSKISSSDPVTFAPFRESAMAKLCIALPPIAIKCTFIYFAFLRSCAPSKKTGITKKKVPKSVR